MADHERAKLWAEIGLSPREPTSPGDRNLAMCYLEHDTEIARLRAAVDNDAEALRRFMLSDPTAAAAYHENESNRLRAERDAALQRAEALDAALHALVDELAEMHGTALALSLSVDDENLRANAAYRMDKAFRLLVDDTETLLTLLTKGDTRDPENEGT